MSRYKGKFLGTFGDLGCFSFSPNKTISTGQGGIIVTNDSTLNTKLRALKDQGRPERGTGGNDRHDTIGYNFKFTNLQAALGLGQLQYLKKRLARMKRNYQLYAKLLKDVKEISVFECDIKNGEVPQWTDIFTDQRDNLEEYLLKSNIHCRKYWFPIHSQKPYKLPDDQFPNSLKMSARSLWLPSAFTLTDKEITTACQEIKKFFK